MRKIIMLIAVILCISGCSMVNTETIAETEITVSENIETEESVCEYEYSVYPDSITIRKYTGTDTNIAVPAEIEGKPVKKIEPAFLAGTDVEEITFSEGISSVPSLSECDKLRVVNLPSTTEIIGTFRFCSALEEININDNLLYKSLEGVLYSEDMKTLVAFPRGREGSFDIPKEVEIIGYYSFENSSLSEVKLSSRIEAYGITEIEDYAFHNCKGFSELILPVNVEKIGFSAFEGASFTSVTLPDGLKSIDSRAFYDTDITDLYLPDSVKECGNNIADDDVLISVSYPLTGYTPLNTRRNTVFRNESTLERALRYAGKQEKQCDGRIFVDINMDNFPEMVEYYGEYKSFSYFDSSSNKWVLFGEEMWFLYPYIWFYDINSDSTIDIYYVTYSEEQNAYLMISDIIYTHYYDYYEQYDYYEPIQYVFTWNDNGCELSTIDTDFIDPDNVQIIKTLDFGRLLEEYNTAVTYQQYELVAEKLSYEPYGEIEEEGLEWRGEVITEFPHYNAFYPDDVRLTVMGRDMIGGEKYPKVSYSDGVLYLDNAVISAEGDEKFIFYCTGMDVLTINISGECYIISDHIRTFFNLKDIPVIIEGNGTLYTTPITVDALELKGNVTLAEYDEGRNKSSVFFSAENVVMNDNSVLHCSSVECEYMTLYHKSDAIFNRIECEVLSIGSDEFEVRDNMKFDCSRLSINGNARFVINETTGFNVNALIIYESGEFIDEERTDPLKVNWIKLNDEALLSVKGKKTCIETNTVYVEGGTFIAEAEEYGRAVNILDLKKDKERNFIIYDNVVKMECDDISVETPSSFWREDINMICWKYRRIYIYAEPNN